MSETTFYIHGRVDAQKRHSSAPKAKPCLLNRPDESVQAGYWKTPWMALGAS